MAGQNAHIDLKYYETSSANYNHRQRAFHDSYKLRGDSDYRFTPAASSEPIVTFPLFRRDEHGFRRYYDSPPPVPSQTAADSLKTPFPMSNTALWELKQGFFPGPGSVAPQPRPNDQRTHSSALRPLTFPYGTPHIESRGVDADTTHTLIGKQRQYATRQTRNPRNRPLSVLTPSERAAIADPNSTASLQEINQLRRSNGALSAPPVLSSADDVNLRETDSPRAGYSFGGWSESPQQSQSPSHSEPQVPDRLQMVDSLTATLNNTEEVAERIVAPAFNTSPPPPRIPKFEKLSADLSRPTSQWNDVYHQHVHYPKNRQMGISAAQAQLTQKQISPAQSLHESSSSPLRWTRTQKALNVPVSSV